ncbi:G-protein coupled receptor Mth2-like isoform X2 [Agrilus planipennis]|uniref:G-protein coupled receptor Mth2-like isoform X2 n=1 Tax=Agrilus planipennis TaxID=224129 RepID=A0A1W4X0Z4_AGRPL|nr:G-protein coupled receptor Mth2-like isoform X2 [Agrilus planipennis]
MTCLVRKVCFYAISVLLFSANCAKCAGNSTSSSNEQQEILAVTYVPVEGFNNSQEQLSSGPILVLDKKTLYITNLKYNTKIASNFWVAYGKNITVAPNEEGLYEPFTGYGGENIYITLPYPLSENAPTYFGIWENKTKRAVASTTIPKNVAVPEAKGYDRNDAEGRRIIRVKKCCPLGEAFSEQGCQKTTQGFHPAFEILDNNKTHVDDTPLKEGSMNIQPFYSITPCPKGALIPGVDSFILLSNGSLVIPDIKKILTQDEFCIETVYMEFENSSMSWTTTAFTCFQGEVLRGGNGFLIVIGIGIIVSIIFLLATASIFIFCKDEMLHSARGKSIAWFSISVAISFVCLAIDYIFTIRGTFCHVMGFIFQLCLMSSFAWLLAITWETLMKIRNYNNSKFTKDSSRFRIYLTLVITLSIAVPFLSVIVHHSVAIPNVFFKADSGVNSCWIDGDKKPVLYLYVPIIAIIIFNVICAVYMKYQLVKLEKQGIANQTDISWITMKDDLKSMFRSCYLVLCIMSLSWVVEIISFFSESTHPAWYAIDMITCLQGFFVFAVFVLHRPIKDRLWATKRRIQSWHWKTPPSSPQNVQLNDFVYPNNSTALLNDNSNDNIITDEATANNTNHLKG